MGRKILLFLVSLLLVVLVSSSYIKNPDIIDTKEFDSNLINQEDSEDRESIDWHYVPDNYMFIQRVQQG